MTIRAFRLLRKLKKAQNKPDESVYIDLDAMTAVMFHDAGQSFKEIKLKAFRTSLDSTLRYLQEQKYIEYTEAFSAVQVLHSGWYLGETMLSNFFGFLFNSVAVPIAVSLATTLITLWIQSLLAS